MKTLYLLRHAHTLSAVPPILGDHGRALSPRGLEEAQKTGMFMRKHDLFPDLVMVSSAIRTTQTARLILNTLFHEIDNDIAIHSNNGLYLSSARKILSEIQKTNNSICHLMLVGHNPSISNLATSLDKNNVLPRFEYVSTGTLIVFKANCSTWKDFSPSLSTLNLVFEPQNGSSQYPTSFPDPCEKQDHGQNQ